MSFIDSEFREFIEKADLPNLLKEYLLRTHRRNLLVDRALIKDIQEIYIEYDSLYIFDEAEFCSYIITGLQKEEKLDYFYHYLKKILEVNLKVFSKEDVSEYKELTKIKNNISNLQENEIPQNLIAILQLLEKYTTTNDLNSLTKAHRLFGILYILFKIFPDNEYNETFKVIEKKLSQ